jgi:hypothetical protein
MGHLALPSIGCLTPDRRAITDDVSERDNADQDDLVGAAE